MNKRNAILLTTFLFLTSLLRAEDILIPYPLMKSLNDFISYLCAGDLGSIKKSAHPDQPLDDEAITCLIKNSYKKDAVDYTIGISLKMVSDRIAYADLYKVDKKIPEIRTGVNRYYFSYRESGWFFVLDGPTFSASNHD